VIALRLSKGRVFFCFYCRNRRIGYKSIASGTMPLNRWLRCGFRCGPAIAGMASDGGGNVLPAKLTKDQVP